MPPRIKKPILEERSSEKGINGMLVPIYKDKKLTVSADGSAMFYSLAYQEAYRAKSIGAFTESLHKFVNASGIIDKARTRDVRIMDLCFGLGYNCATTFHMASQQGITNRLHIVSIEKDAHLLELVRNMPILWPLDGYHMVRNCLQHGYCGNASMEIYVMEALEAIYHINGLFDAIYFDPFSMSKNPEMWQVEVFARLRSLLAADGVLVTYACGKKARANMLEAGLKIEAVSAAKGAFHPGTLASR
ncbi:MAG: hypothetical protein LBV04_08215 [Deferribacteraceae bacterium]|jgi:chorismate dehydratase|nr:hypothetical protein [Deferribacteraceae bacterium]